MLDAKTCVHQMKSGVLFAFVGDGPYLEQCRRRAPAGTVFLGRLEGEALSALYASADVFAFPSSTETFGNVLVEAMASGLPVVAADTSATREIVGRTGLLHEPDDPQLLANALLGLILNDARRRSLGRAARIRSGQFSWAAVFDALFAEYEAALGRRDVLRTQSTLRLASLRQQPQSGS